MQSAAGTAGTAGTAAAGTAAAAAGTAAAAAAAKSSPEQGNDDSSKVYEGSCGDWSLDCAQNECAQTHMTQQAQTGTVTC